MNEASFAPGARLLIRDEEWIVKTVLPTNTGGKAIRVIGLSELVRNHEAIFLTELDKVLELKPEETQLVPDESPQYRRSRLYIESLLRRTPPTDEKIYLGDKAAIDFAPYQVQPAHMAMKALRPRILIADGVGLGKTIEAGILLCELIKRGHGERILVVAVRSMLTQFQQEIWARFSIPLVRLDSIGVQRVRAKIPSNKNPFYYYDRVIVSVDTLKNDAQYRHYLEQCHWDVIVIDECHNVANAGSERNRLAALLSRTCDSLIMTSATPHNGRPESFANLMNMLEPTAIADSTDYTAEDISGLFVRRFKKDIEDQVKGQFSDRTVEIKQVDASPEEEAFFERLAKAKFHTLDHGWSNDALYRIGLLKGFLSSPGACLQTIDGRIGRVKKRLDKLEGRLPAENGQDADDDLSSLAPELFKDFEKKARFLKDLKDDLASLDELKALTEKVTGKSFRKYNRLVELLQELGAIGRPGSPRVIIFSERIATLQFLFDNLKKDLDLDDDAIIQFHAGLPDVDQQDIVESFGKEDSPRRILIASDVASEGVNLHYYCHLMIHFDIPWSLITLEQRNGRIDRFGQHQSPLIYYLLTVSKNPQIEGDLRVLNKLIEKEQEARKNIGDAATILGLYDAQREEEKITAELADGKTPEEIFTVISPEQDWLAMLMSESAPPVEANILSSLPRLYNDDLEFAKVAFDELAGSFSDLTLPEFHPDRPEFTLLTPEDLRRRCEFMPQEAVPNDWNFRLTTDRKRVMKAIADARKRQGEWPEEQLFWELHPVMEWLLDKLQVQFGRHEAPVILASQVPPGKPLFLFQGVLSNRRSQPVISEWFGVQMIGKKQWQALAFEQVMEQTQFKKGLANTNQKTNMSDLVNLLPDAVEFAREYMGEQRMVRGQALGDRLRADQRKLKKWYDSAKYRLDKEEMTARGAQATKVLHERNEIKALYQQRLDWLSDTFTAVNIPYLRVIAVFATG
jgi:SNF2 family DNA or RNA helicase